jgi:orotate phosphoribosyltransferase
MNNEAIMQILTKVGAVITNSHIVYTSERHGNAYINKDALYTHTKETSELCKIMAQQYNANEIDVVIGPIIGGVVLSQWVAHHLNNNRSKGETLALYAEKEGEGEDKKLVIKRGYDAYIPGKNVVVVEDVLTTGGSARKVIEIVKALGGNVIALSALCNRGGIKPSDIGDIPIHALTTITMDSWTEQDCPLCKEKIAINTSVGKGKIFLQKRGVGV